MKFKRGLYEGEAQYLSGLDTFEGLYETLLKLPSADEVQFFSVPDHQKAAESGDAEYAAFHLIFDAYNWLKFFWYTNMYKATKLSEGLIDAYNAKNYLVWLILTRSLVEYSSVFYYYQKKANQFELNDAPFKASQLKGFDDLMLQFAHGSRFNWNDLFNGEVDKIAKTYDSVQDSPTAVNVLTAIKHLSKRDPRFKQLEVSYAMLSDFAHPNKASHTAVIDRPLEHQASTHRCRVALDPDSLRGESLMALSLPTATLALSNSVEMVFESSRLLRRWLEMFDNKEQLSIDFSA